MKIFIPEYDKHNAYRAAILNIARLQNIPDYEYKSNRELYNEIYATDSPLINSLNAYLKAYNKWFDFYKKRKVVEEDTDEEYILDDNEQLELTLLITARQDSLDNLQAQVNSLR